MFVGTYQLKVQSTISSDYQGNWKRCFLQAKLRIWSWAPWKLHA